MQKYKKYLKEPQFMNPLLRFDMKNRVAMQVLLS